MGVQATNNDLLKIIGRRHTVDQTVEAFRLARQEGFDNINMDIILGLPEETPEDVAETIRRIEALEAALEDERRALADATGAAASGASEELASAEREAEETGRAAAEEAAREADEAAARAAEEERASGSENGSGGVPHRTV